MLLKTTLTQLRKLVSAIVDLGSVKPGTLADAYLLV